MVGPPIAPFDIRLCTPLILASTFMRITDRQTGWIIDALPKDIADTERRAKRREEWGPNNAAEIAALGSPACEDHCEFGATVFVDNSLFGDAPADLRNARGG
jgi:hypothetical protein